MQIAFITCLKILNLCNVPQPTVHGYRAKGTKWLSEAAKRNNATDYVD